jgi:hypothetical protein
MSGRAYMHEYIHITGANRAKYFEHMTANWRTGAHERKQKTFGVWGTVGSTANWPEVVNLWEYDSWETIADSFDHETKTAGMQDPFLKEWWLQAQPLRRGGYDRLLLPAAYSPSIDEVIARGIVGWPVFRQDLIVTLPGAAPEYLDMVGQQLVPLMKPFGMEMIGAYRTAMRDDTEVMLFWAIKSYRDWMAAERAYDATAEFKAWRQKTRAISPNYSSHLMCSAPLSPTQTGKQP